MWEWTMDAINQHPVCIVVMLGFWTLLRWWRRCERRAARLEREAQWLAGEIAKLSRGGVLPSVQKRLWRTRAREAVSGDEKT